MSTESPWVALAVKLDATDRAKPKKQDTKSTGKKYWEGVETVCEVPKAIES